MGRSSYAILIGSIILTAIAVHTCVRIEAFNGRVGGFLPRKPDTEHGAISKWRVAVPSILRQAKERKFLAEAEQAGRPMVVTEAQEAEIVKAINAARINADFRDFVATWGLAQYLVAPIALLLGILLLGGRKRPVGIRIAGAAAATLTFGCIAMMLYRGYFSSLGW